MGLKVFKKTTDKISVPVVIDKEGKWLVARIPLLGLATQGRTVEEVKENIADLLNLYFENPHTPKPDIQSFANMDVTLTTVAINVPKGVSR